MTATTTRKGPCPPDHDVAAVTFDEDNSKTPPKRYFYWVPKRWKAQPGDKLRVCVSEREALKTVTVRDMHFAGDFAGSAHKLAVSITRAAPKVTGFEPPAVLVTDDWFTGEVGMIDDIKVHTDKPTGFDQMTHYRQAIERIRRITEVPPELLGTGRWPHTIPAAQPKDNAMNIETYTFVNGQRVDQLTEDQLFDLIAKEETAMKALRNIDNKPQKLKDRINKMQADIEKLIKLIDER